MFSKIFGPKEDDDYDEIFKLDSIDTEPAGDNRITVERAFQTPRFDDLWCNNEKSQLFNADFGNHSFSSDSAVGTESQMTKHTTISTQPNRFNPIANEFLESQVFLSRPAMNQERDNIFQSMNVRSDDCLHLSYNNMHHSILDNFPFSDFTQRSVMELNLEPPSSFLEQAFETPRIIEDNLTQSPHYSNLCSDNLSQEIPVPESQYDVQPQRAASESLLTGCSTDDFCLRIEESLRDSQGQDFLHILSNQVPLNDISNAYAVPESIFELYKQIKTSELSDWSFVYALSAQTCQEFMPMNYNITLKTSLLLSIASIDTKIDSAPIPIIAFGQDSSSANSIMNYMGNFAQRFLAPTDHFFNVTINSDKIVEVGPAFLAKNGVCYLGDWSGLSKKNSDELKILIDSGRLFLNQTSENFELNSALWAYWSSTQKNKKDFTNVAIFIKYFGIPIMTDTNESEDIIEFLLTEARDGKVDVEDDILNICNEDMKNYLNIVRKIKVRKTEGAQKLLKLYSDTIQVDREGLLSAKGFQIIQQMADSFAKLSLRDETLVCDVVSAISIAEKTFYAITGSALAPLLPLTQEIQMVDQYIEAFHKWIFNYVGMI